MKKLFFLIVTELFLFSFSSAQGIVRGKVTDKNGETLIGVTIVLKSNPSYGTTTDFDGNYSLKIKDSTAQVLVVSYVSYKTREESVFPSGNEIIVKDFVLESASQDLGVVEVVAKSSREKEYYMENFKKNSSTTIDYISSETMKKTGDPNVTSAVARVSGVSTNGSFITVRGIGDRYVKTTINGSRIPTLDPFTNNIKLDIIPASLVDNIIITKTASPDLPADWAGAYISVETKDYPEKLSVNVESSVGYNNQTAFKNVLAVKQSPTDWLGYDNGFRDQNHNSFVPIVLQPTIYMELVALGLGDYFNSMGITNQTPWNDTYFKLGLVQLGLLDKASFDDPEAFKKAKEDYAKGSYKDQAYNSINAAAAKSGQSFPNNWNTFYKKAPLNFTQSFSVGNQTQLFERPLGIIAGFRYGNSVQYDPNSVANRTILSLVDSEGKPLINTSMNQQFVKYTNGWSALVNLAYKYSPNHGLSLLFMPNFSGVNNIRNGVDTTGNSTYAYEFTKSQFYEERKQLIYQLKSEHYFPGSKLKLELNASYTKGESSAPDFKNLTYYANDNLDYQFDQTLSDVRRNYRYLKENLLDSRIAAELPIGNKSGLSRKLKFGGAYQDNTRKFDQYDYFLHFNAGSTLLINNNDLDGFFNLDKFGISTSYFNGKHQTIDLYYEEFGNPANHTIGFSKVTAGFVMVDYTIIPVLRVSGGVRVEKTNIFTDVYKYNNLGYEVNDSRRIVEGQAFITNPGKLNKTNYLPSANIIYKLRKDETRPVNLRLNYSQTIARPSIREFSETIMRDNELNADVFGNAELKMVQINNYDFRIESFFRSGDNLSLSIFYKDLKNHIELVSSNIGYSWTNVDDSRVTGIELEGRKKLTKQFEFRANITFVDSRTTVAQKQLNITNGVKTWIPIDTLTRPMFGQAPYVINGIVSYSNDSLGLGATLSYNVQGERLILTSVDGAPDVYELPRHLLDFKITKRLGKHFTVSITVRDILNSPIRRSYNYKEGWILDYDRYRYGTNYILGISYKL